MNFNAKLMNEKDFKLILSSKSFERTLQSTQRTNNPYGPRPMT
jgi:hypothetical protein